jgi:Tfp pilus assembly protein PilX
MDTARHLLFGVLAWRAGLLDADQFTSGCRRWGEYQNQPLAEVLVERGWLTAADRASLEQLLERNVQMHNGNALDALKGVADAGTWRAVAATQDAGLRHWLVEVLPGAVWLDEDEHKPKRGLVGGLTALVVALALVGVVILLGMVGSSMLFMKQRAHMAMAELEAVRARDEAEAARQQAEVNFQRARAAVDQVLTEVSQKTTEKSDLGQMRRELLEQAVTYYEAFLQEQGAKPASRHEVAKAYRKLGEVQQQLGHKDKAQQAYMQARDSLQKLAKEAPDNEAYRKELAEIEEKLKPADPPD